METEASETIILVRQAKEGDADALNQLFQRFASFVRRIIELRIGRTPSRREDIDDLVQDALLRAYRGFDGFGGGVDDNFRAWIACCARSAMLDEYKHQYAQKRGGGERVVAFSELDSNYFSSSILDRKVPTPSKIAVGRELEQAIIENLGKLSARHRNLIIYRKLCGFSYAEIAELLHVSNANTVKTLCHRALGKLESLLSS